MLKIEVKDIGSKWANYWKKQRFSNLIIVKKSCKKCNLYYRAGVWEDNDPSLTVSCYNEIFTGGGGGGGGSSVDDDDIKLIDEVFDNDAPGAEGV